MFFRQASTAVKARLEPIKTEIKAAEPQTVELHESAKECVYEKKDVGEDQNQYVRMASKISNNDLDFLATFNAENGLFNPFRKHPFANKDGSRDYGCGLNSTYHLKFIRSADFKDAHKNIQYCYDIFKKRPTAFYGYYKREEQKKLFSCN